MGMWTSLALLSVAAVSTLSFPHPGPPIPPVGAGTRAQYYVLKPDGTFTYGYDTGNGLHETATKLESGVIEGAFGYKNSDGEDILLQYTAGEGGFIPRGNFLPKSVEAPALSSSQGSVSQYSAPVRAAPAPAPATPIEIAEIRGGNPEADGSYHFSYDTSSSSRSETADADLNIIGRYSFIAGDGVSRSVDYKAGSATGFIAEGDHLPKVSDDEFGVHAAPQTSASAPSLAYSAPSESSVNLVATKNSSPSAPRSDASYSFSYDAGDSARSESADADLNIVGSYRFTADDGVSRSVNYQAGSETGFIAEGDHLPKPVDALAGAGYAATSYKLDPINTIRPQESITRGVVPDASYSFSYDAGDSARSESADADLNIVGNYRFTADDGVSRSVNYQAGSATGFIAEGDHLPKPVDPLAVTGSTASSYQAQSSFTPVRSTFSASPVAFEEAAIRGGVPDIDGSYHFSYDTSSSSRSESADALNSVTGSFGFEADDGVHRSIQYTAGAETGFIANGAHLPVGPPVPGAESGIPTGRILPILLEDEANALAAATSGAARSSSSPSFNAPSAVIKSSIPVTSASDASYSFSYNAGDSSRTESADADLNVLGSYSFTADDGVSRSVNYKAGSATGFIAEGDHLPKPVVAEIGTSPVASYSVPATSYTASAQLRSSDSSDEDDSTPSDASYSFSFVSDSYSRNEEADVDGNVKGSYTYTGDDGILRTVNFVAGRETGFSPEGEYTEAAGSSVSSASHSAPSSASYSAPSTSYQAAAAPTSPALSYSAPSHSSNVATKSSALPTVSGNALDSVVIGDVNQVHANAEASPTMYGYSFTAI